MVLPKYPPISFPLLLHWLLPLARTSFIPCACSLPSAKAALTAWVQSFYPLGSRHFMPQQWCVHLSLQSNHEQVEGCP